MFVNLVTRIECGEKTCASEPGKFCKCVVTTKFGTRYACNYFQVCDNKGWVPKPLKEEDGWLMRCKECLEQGETGNAPSLAEIAQVQSDTEKLHHIGALLDEVLDSYKAMSELLGRSTGGSNGG